MSSRATEPDGVEVTMPETGSDDGALLISWLKAPGGAVEEEEPICLVRVGDLDAEIVSPATGVVGGIFAEAGTRVRAGESLARIVEAQSIARDPEPEPEPESELEPEPESEPEPEPEANPEPESEPEPEPQAQLDPLANLASQIETLELTVPAINIVIPPAPELEEAEDEPEEAAGYAVAEPAPAPSDELEPKLLPDMEPAPLPLPPLVELRSFRSPAVRRLAADHGIDPATLAGTGRGGRVTRADVLAAVEKG